MSRVLESIFRYFAGRLGTANGNQAATDSASKGNQGEQGQSKTAGSDKGNSETQGDKASTPKSIRQTWRDHWQWLRKRPPVILLVVAIVVILALAEKWLLIVLGWLVQRLGQIPAGRFPAGLFIDPAGGRVLVALWGDDTVAEIR